MGNKIKQYAEDKKMSILELSKSTGITRGYIYSLINDDSIPSISLARKLAHKLGTSTDKLFPDK